MSKKRSTKQVQIGVKKNLNLTIYEELKSGLNPAQISKKYGWSKSRISNHVKSLKDQNLIKKIGYGVWEIVENMLPENKFKQGVPLSPQVQKKWRFHNIHYVIEPFQFAPRYAQIINSIIDWREWKAKFHKKTIEIQLRSKHDFIDVDKYKVIREADESFNRTLFELQNKYGFQAWKQGEANIKLVNQHLARTPSGIADTREGKEHLKIRSKDGKIFFLTDKSKSSEHEYVNPTRAIVDSEKVEPYLNDFLENQPPTNTQLAIFIKEQAKNNIETSAGLNAIVTLLKNLLGADLKPSDKTSNKELTPATYIG